MNLLHKCGNSLSVTATGLSVVVLDFGIKRVLANGQVVIGPALLDIHDNGKNTLEFSCEPCNENNIGIEDIMLYCPKCGRLFPITRVFQFPGKYVYICEPCVDKLLTLHTTVTKAACGPLSIIFY